MSEEERKQRMNYRKRRKGIIAIQSIILILAAIITVFAGALSIALNKTYYVDYSEKSSVDWGVHLKENDFYSDSYLGKDYAYIASLIDKVQAKFTYGLEMDSKNPIDFEYAYRVDAVVQIKNKLSGRVLFSSVHSEIPEKKISCVDKSIKISQTLVVDYAKYNDLASRFISTYNLDGAEANLLLNMQVDVLGKSEEFDGSKNSNSYVSSVSIPLTSKTVEVKATSSVPKEEQKVLSYTTENTAAVFKKIATLFAILTAIFAIVLLAYAYLSRNIDITYDIKVARLVRNYKSFIQKIRNNFDVSKYQVLIVDTFGEMLEIRDTIQSPILFEENRDKTCSRFLIPTLNGLVYLYEIRVDDYDEIYSQNEESAVPASLAIVEASDIIEAPHPVAESPISNKPDAHCAYNEQNRHEETETKTVTEWIVEPCLYLNDGKPKKKKKKMRVRITLNEEK